MKEQIEAAESADERRKSRSPNYPALSLPEAIKGVKLVYENDHLHKMGKVVVAKHLGYASLNGASLGAVSALAKYGLLETIDDSYKVSGDALAILVDPVTAPDRQAAIRRAALKPALFAELHQFFGGQTPSEENLKAHLQKKGFIPNAAVTAARAFRETMELVSREGGMYDPQQPKDEPPGGIMEPARPVPAHLDPNQMPATERLRQAQLARLAATAVATGEREFAYMPLGETRGLRVSFLGDNLSQQDIDDLIEYLRIVQKRLPKGGDEPPTE